MRYFKNTMEWMWWNLYGSSIQIWTQTKKKNAPKDQIKTEFRLTLKSKQETNESRKVLLRFVDKFGITWLDKTYRFRK